MLSRRRFLTGGLLGLTFLLPGASALAETQLDAETIRTALQATPQEDRGFIDRVVAQMQENARLRRIVSGVFLKARNRPRNRFGYFRYGVTQMAAREGITLQ